MTNTGRTHFKKGQVPWNKGIKQTNIAGEKSPFWKKEVSYGGVHKWLMREYGKANKCESSKCEAEDIKKHEWALVRGKTYEKIRENFIQLCASCHRRYDETQKTGWITRRNRASR